MSDSDCRFVYGLYSAQHLVKTNQQEKRNTRNEIELNEWNKKNINVFWETGKNM